MGQGPHLGQGTPILFRASDNLSEPLSVVICTLGHLGRRPFAWGAEPQENNTGVGWTTLPEHKGTWRQGLGCPTFTGCRPGASPSWEGESHPLELWQA